MKHRSATVALSSQGLSENPVLMQFENTTNRSWWIISNPTYTRGRKSAIKSHQREPF
jgi:hypothetical protein